MAPEQVRGEPADHRSDIFALGCILYEMLAGTPPFHAGTTPEILAAILRDQAIDLSALGLGIPPRVSALVGRCLEKNPDGRFQARDLAYALRDALSDPRDRTIAAWIRTRTPRRRVTLFAAAAAIIFSILWLAGRALPSTETGVPIRTLAVLPLENVSGDRQQDGFAETMTEQLTARLAGLRDWRVTSAASALTLHHREPRMPVSQFAAELGVAAVVEGTVTRHGSSMTIVVQLVDGRTARSLWRNVYEESLDDVLVAQNEIARAIARRTDVGPEPDAPARLARAPRKVVSASYDA